jgi:iron-sulfur cluster assembly protein
LPRPRLSALACEHQRVKNITITPAASARMRQFLANAPTAAGVRFGVKRTGCSGFGYVVDLAQTVDAGESVVEIDGLPMVVSDASVALVEGTVIDFQRQGLNASFVFHNPNATGACGCGESFTVG